MNIIRIMREKEEYKKKKKIVDMGYQKTTYSCLKKLLFSFFFLVFFSAFESL